jgi:hypothetical protein
MGFPLLIACKTDGLSSWLAMTACGAMCALYTANHLSVSVRASVLQADFRGLHHISVYGGLSLRVQTVNGIIVSLVVASLAYAITRAIQVKLPHSNVWDQNWKAKQANKNTQKIRGVKPPRFVRRPALCCSCSARPCDLTAGGRQRR